MQQVRAEQEQQRISATRLHDQMYHLKESLLALHATMESKSSPGAEDIDSALIDFDDLNVEWDVQKDGFKKNKIWSEGRDL